LPVIKEYAPIIFQLIIAIGIAVGGVGLSMVLGKKGRNHPAQSVAYECGKDAMGKVQSRFSVKFYLVAMIFILFDIEVIFMYPWAVGYLNSITSVGVSVFWAMVAFVIILEVGHLYAYKKGVFDWNKR
jgi:NADH-quinone oxidoreductase subunit A